MARKPEHILEELLVLNIQAGDQKAMEALVKRYHMKLVAYTYRKLNDKEAALDIIQDTWKVVFTKIRFLNDPATFRSWVYRIVNNKSNDWIRKQVKTRKMTAELGQIEIESAPSEDRSEQMKRALQQLNQEQITLIELYYKNEMSVAEISEMLNIPSGTVKSRLFTTRATLKRLMQKIQRQER